MLYVLYGGEGVSSFVFNYLSQKSTSHYRATVTTGWMPGAVRTSKGYGLGAGLAMERSLDLFEGSRCTHGAA